MAASMKVPMGGVAAREAKRNSTIIHNQGSGLDKQFPSIVKEKRSLLSDSALPMSHQKAFGNREEHMVDYHRGSDARKPPVHERLMSYESKSLRPFFR